MIRNMFESWKNEWSFNFKKKKSLLFAFAYQGAGKSNKYILNKILQTELIARP